MRRWVVARRFSQIFFFILFIYILWSTTYPLTGFLRPEIFFKLDPLIMLVTSISERILIPGALFTFIMLTLTVIFGRFFCGWICPLGTSIDMVGALRRKAQSQTDATNKKLRAPKFYLLAIITLAALFGMQIAWFFDPIVIMARFVSLNLIPFLGFVIDGMFVFFIKYLHLYGPVYDFYHRIKPSFLGINIYTFSHSGIILLFFLFICAGALLLKRAWCRALCPLGALYALFARYALLHRTVERCARCKPCKSSCRTGAILDDTGYVKSECILCMDCLYDCHLQRTYFKWPFSKRKPEEIRPPNAGAKISRKDFLLLLFISIASFGMLGFRKKGSSAMWNGAVVRPPAALKEEEFLNRCVRCGNCMKVCITNGLQPVIFESGLAGIWTPQLVPEIGYCEYNCTLCGRTCPTGAIPALTLDDKRNVRLGLAEIDRTLCISWAEGRECIVCEEHCPVFQKAIKLKSESIDGKTISKPFIDEELCIGCGICQNKCPVRPTRAVRVSPRKSDRT